MSREVLGALDDATPDGDPRAPAEADEAAPATLRLDDDSTGGGRPTAPGPAAGGPVAAPSDRAPDPDPDAPAGPPAQGRGRAAHLWHSVRHLVQHPRSRTPAVALVVVAGLVGAVLGAAVAQRAALAGREQTASVSAWITYSASGSGTSPRYSLFVVNSGQASLTVTEADLGGGIDEGRGPVDLALEAAFEVAPGKAGQATVTATSECAAGPLSEGGARDGNLRVTVATQDLREQVLEVPNLAGMSLSAVDVYNEVCQRPLEQVPVVADLTSRADGRLSLSLSSVDGADHEVSLRGPDGIALVTEPPMPVTLVGRQAQVLALGLEVDFCTQNATQLLAGDQVQLVVDGESLDFLLDPVMMTSWFAREVAKVCAR